jgi:hypothetical protein
MDPSNAGNDEFGVGRNAGEKGLDLCSVQR